METTMTKAIVFDAYGTLFDVQSVADVTDAAFPGYGQLITQIWRIKQLEYSWLRSMMDDYQDFWAVTRQSLSYTLDLLDLSPSDRLFDDIAEAYNRLRPYPDAEEALASLSGHRLAILSNGSPGMLAALVGNSVLDKHIKLTISVDSKRVFKPDPRAYALVEEQMGVKPHEVIFVSSNGFDVCGAKKFGFRVARIARVSPQTLREELGGLSLVKPVTMFQALRMQPESLGHQPDFVISSLKELVTLTNAAAPKD